MYTLLVCHRRQQGIGYGKFHTYWQEQRSRLVGDLHEKLGYSQYGQLHQVSRLNFLYQVIRLSRSPLVTGLIAQLQGKTLPPSTPDRHTQREERWDVVEEFRYPNKVDAVEALTVEAGVRAIQRLATDQAPWVRRVAVVTAEEFPVTTDPEPPAPQIKTVFCLRSRPDLTREGMLSYWGTDHKELVLSVQSALGYRAYDQWHVRSVLELADTVKALSVNAGEEFDGVANLTYRSQGQILWGFFSPSTQAANLKLVKDEITFIDSQRSVLMFGRHYVFDPVT